VRERANGYYYPSAYFFSKIMFDVLPLRIVTNLKTTTAELLSTFCDNLMRNPKVEELELDNTLEKVVRLFGYISEKVFFN